MPKLHIIGSPLDLYRYKTFLEVLIDNNKDWGVSLSFNSRIKNSRSFIRKIQSIAGLFIEIYRIWEADIVYIPPMVITNFLPNKILIKACDIFKKKVVFDFYISIYDSLVLDRKHVLSDSKEAKTLSSLDYWGHTRWISIYLNPCEAKRYRALNGLGLDKNVRIIPLSISERPHAVLNYFNKNHDGVFNMVWWGTYIPLHGLNKIIDAVSLLYKKGANIHLHILGNKEASAKEYMDKVERIEGLSSVITISNDMTFSNGKLLPFIQNNCDLAFGAFGDSDKARSVILNKAIEAVAMKIPVLTQFSPAFEEYFPKDSSIFYTDNTPESMANSITEIMSMSKEELETRLTNALQIYKTNFSIDASKRMFKEVLDELKESCI